MAPLFSTGNTPGNYLKACFVDFLKIRHGGSGFLFGFGTGGTGVESDDNVIPAEHFTFSTMVLPAGCEGPLHLHTDAEEVFFVLRGNKLRFIVEHQGERFETLLKERDLFSVPPGVYRGLVNEGIEEALMCVIIGNSKPVTPTYPPEHPLSKIKRPKGAGAG